MLPLLTVFLGGHGALDLPSLLVWPLLILSFKSPGLSATTQRTHSFLCPAPSVHLSLTQRYSRQPVLLVWFCLLQKFLWSQFPKASYSHGFADAAPSGFLQPWPQSSDIPIYLFRQNFLIFNRLLAFFNPSTSRYLNLLCPKPNSFLPSDTCLSLCDYLSEGHLTVTQGTGPSTQARPTDVIPDAHLLEASCL